MKSRNKKSIFIMVAILLLILLVSAGTKRYVAKPMDVHNFEDLNIVTDSNILKIRREEISINTYNNIGITEGQSEIIKNVIKNDFLVNDDTIGSTIQFIPRIAMDSIGNFIIVWRDNRNGNADIYSQRYDNTGTVIGANFKVNDDIGTAAQYYPNVSINDTANFIVVWRDNRNGNYDIYSQRYDNTGTVIGTNFIVNDDEGTSNQLRPSISMNNIGNFVIVWMDIRNDNWDIYSQRYDNVGTTVGINFIVNDDAGTISQSRPIVSINSNGKFVIVWMDYYNGYDWDIYSQRYDSTGTVVGTNFIVNDDGGTSAQAHPNISMGNTGNFVVVWHDYRNGDYDIYSQRYDNTGAIIGANFKVNDDTIRSGQYCPSVSMGNTGNFVVVWHDRRNGDYDIYAQRYDTIGTSIGTNFMVNTPGSAYRFYPSVSMDNAENFVIVWLDFFEFANISLQRYDNTGTVVGTKLKVNDRAGIKQQVHPKVSMNNSGNFVIVWENYMINDWNIYSQRYDNTGTVIGTNFIVNDDAGTTVQSYPSISIDNSGNFVIVWEAYKNGDWDIYSQIYDNTGLAQGANFKVNDDAGTADQRYPCVSMDPDSNRFIIYWTDYRNIDGDPEIMAQKYINGMPIDSNVQVNVDSLPYYHQESSTEGIACNSNTIIFAWKDNRRAKGWDIYGKLTDWDINSGIDDYQPLSKKQERIGINAYPNPFCKSIMITGGTGEYSIYDISGRLVNKVDSGLWNGKDKNGKEIMNGIYYIKNNEYKSIKIIRMK